MYRMNRMDVFIGIRGVANVREHPIPNERNLASSLLQTGPHGYPGSQDQSGRSAIHRSHGSSGVMGHAGVWFSILPHRRDYAKMAKAMAEAKAASMPSTRLGS